MVKKAPKIIYLADAGTLYNSSISSAKKIRKIKLINIEALKGMQALLFGVGIHKFKWRHYLLCSETVINKLLYKQG